MQDKNMKIQDELFISEYSNQYEFLQDYFELIDLFNERLEAQECIPRLQRDMISYNILSDNEKDSLSSKQMSKKHRFLENLKIIKYRIDDKKNIIREREELSKEKIKTFPIIKIKDKYKLDDIEFKILIALLKNEMSIFYSSRLNTGY